MKPLKQILLYIRNLIDKIIIKIEPPQPIRFPPYPQIYNNTMTYTGSAGILINATAGDNCIITGNTYDGTSTGINIYDSVG